jgi:TPP-dependent pyruvate/acetoin dehydrogenase alpha subunit
VTTLTLDLLETYRTMVTIRRFEERCQELRMRDAIAGSIHLCAGQ